MGLEGVAVLTDEQRALLVAALNRIIPAEGELPGAGDLGAASVIERRLAPAPVVRRTLLAGLAQIEIAAWQRAERPFVGISAQTQDEVLRAVEQSSPLFFDLLVSHTYQAYYVNPRVLTLLGLEARPPQPLGHTLPPFDPARLARVRQRGRLYRTIGDSLGTIE
jgi:hypothetical protein